MKNIVSVNAVDSHGITESNDTHTLIKAWDIHLSE
jgi:hypothetical protein